MIEYDKYLYKHQHDAILQKSKYSKCLINMWCGTGKTRTFTISLFQDNQDINVIVFPSLGLINQYNNDYFLNNNPIFRKSFDNYICLAFCSDDDTKLKIKSSSVKYTTNLKTLHTFLKRKDKKLILVTYQSFEKFVEVFTTENIRINRLIYDEAHHIVGGQIQDIVFNNEAFNNIVDKTEFYTATPINRNEIVMFDKSNPENSDCGPIAYEYLYYQAVEDNVCKAFTTEISLYCELPKYVNKYQPIFELIIRACLSGKYDYWNVLTYHSFVNESDMNNDVSFVKDFSSTQNKRLVKQLFSRIQNEEFPETIPIYSVENVILKGVHSKTPNRHKIIEEFDKKMIGRIYILSSCGILNEGIDTKWANMAVPINPTQSIVKESQRIGRLCRLPEPNMPDAVMVIPCLVDIEKYKTMNTDEEQDQMIRAELSESGNFNTALNVISAFKYQYDPELYEMCLRYPNMYAPSEVVSNLEKYGLKVEECKGELIDNLQYLCDCKDISIDLSNKEDSEDDTLLDYVASSINRRIEIHTQDHDNPIKYINKGCDDDNPLILFYSADDDNYSPVIKKTGKKIEAIHPYPKRKKIFNVHTHPDIDVLWKISDIKLNGMFGQGVLDVDVNWKEVRWFEKLDELKKFIDKEKRRPIKGSKNINEKQLGNWIGTQIATYKIRKYIMNSDKIYDSWTDFVNDERYSKYFSSNEYKWYDRLNDVKHFMDKEERRPIKESKNINERQLGGWLINQIINFKNKKYIMKDKTIYKVWDNFINDQKYSKYFIDSNNKWLNNLHELKDFIDNKNRRPIAKITDLDEKQLHKWLSHQITNHKTKKQIMKDETIYQTWTDFIHDPKYSKYFIDNNDKWLINLQELKEFIDDNDRRPSQESKNINERQLSNWVGTQLKNYKKKKKIMKDETIYQIWIDFIHDPKYSKYFIDNNDKWLINLRELKEFIYNNDRRPSHESKNINERQLGVWLSTQLRNYKTKKYIMTDETIYETWTNFVNNKKYSKYFTSETEKWFDRLNELKEFIDINKKKPTKGSKNINEKKLVSWLDNQLRNYKTKKYIMTDETIYDMWTDLINNQKYNSYFIDRDDKWFMNLQKLKEFIDNNNRRPNKENKNINERQLGNWLKRQTSNYKTKNCIMTDEIIYNKWSDFINNPKYSKYVIDRDDKWLMNLQELKQFLNNNERRPNSDINRKSINGKRIIIELNELQKKEKQLGSWLGTQQKNNKTKEEIMSNPTIHQTWTEFITNPQYSKYFPQPNQKDMSKPNIQPKSDKKGNPPPRSQLSELHKKYKTMNSTNLHQHFQANSNDWKIYHNISKENEKTFPKEEIPRNLMIKYINELPGKKQKIVADLGCGFAEINEYFENNNRFKFHNFDHIADNEKVIQKDIEHTGLDDYSVDIAILSLAMWGSNCHKYINEVYRILDTGGTLLIAEPYKRWNKEDGINELVKLLENNNFIIINNIEKKFMFIEARKK